MNKANMMQDPKGTTGLNSDDHVAVIDEPERKQMAPPSPTAVSDVRSHASFVPASIVLENGLTYHLNKQTTIANAGPIGLMAFGITTTLLNILNAGLVNSQAIVIIVAYGAMHGGLVQVLAGMWEMKRGSTFAALAFSTYGAFWLGFALIQIMAAGGLFPATELQSGLCAWLCVWGVFTMMMWINTFRMNRALQFVFGTLTVLFFLLAGGEYNATCKKVAGWLGMVCGLSAMYVGWAELTNEIFERTLLPLFPVKPKPDNYRV